MSFNAEKAFASRIVMLSGEEEAFRRRALGELQAIAVRDGNFDLQTFEAEGSNPHEWIASAGTAPFLSERRTVIVRHLLRQDNLDGLAAPMKALPPSGLLILVADEETGDENKQRRLQTIRKNWEKLVTSAGGVVADFSTNSKQIKEAIKAEADRLGKKISEASADSLAEMTGGSFSRAIEELEKLAIYVGNEPQIREGDIRAIVVPSRDWNVYKLVDAIVDASVPEALRQLRILVGSQTKAEDAAFSRILPMLSRQFRLLWQARLCVDAKASVEAAPDEVRRLFISKASIAKEPPYRQSRLMQQARRVSFDALTSCLQAITDADCKIKGLLDSFSPIETLEQMVLQMVGYVSPKVGVR